MIDFSEVIKEQLKKNKKEFIIKILNCGKTYTRKYRVNDIEQFFMDVVKLKPIRIDEENGIGVPVYAGE